MHLLLSYYFPDQITSLRYDGNFLNRVGTAVFLSFGFDVLRSISLSRKWSEQTTELLLGYQFLR